MWNNEIKFYVVRKGKKIWIFDSRNDCKESVNWFSGAKYKSFWSKEEAEIAMTEWREKFYEIKNTKAKKNNLKKLSDEEKIELEENVPFFSESLAVDAACSGNPWKMEYRWIDLKTWEEIFLKKFEIWTNNIWEFLAIVDWLKYLKDHENKVIYSDSKIAISRVNQWKCKTQLKMGENNENNSDFFALEKSIKEAETWLKDNAIIHKILKWDTEKWWEIPADFGRK